MSSPSTGTLISSNLAHLTNPPLDFWDSFQLQSFLWRCSRTPIIFCPLTCFESLWQRGRDTSFSFWCIRLWFTLEKTMFLYFSLNGKPIWVWALLPSKDKRFSILSSIATWVQETSYKTITRWYRVPHPTSSFLPPGCRLLLVLWQYVTTTIKQPTAVDLHANPVACLLHLTERPIKKYKIFSYNANPKRR